MVAYHFTDHVGARGILYLVHGDCSSDELNVRELPELHYLYSKFFCLRIRNAWRWQQ
jgi:hypothetical protein